MHVHLDPVGGIAGDMFVAAMLDACPELHDGLLHALDEAGVTKLARLTRRPFTDQILTGSMVDVVALPAASQSGNDHEHHHHHHRHHADIVQMLDSANLDDDVIQAAKGIFYLLAEAESEVHGVDIAKIAFHEVGNWDSITDIVSAAWLICRCDASSWSCSALPMGRGRIEGAHGVLPLPAPATALLLRQMPLYTDVHEGERITPTGAAILRYLQPDFGPRQQSSELIRTGNGFGHKQFQGMSNVLRILCFKQLSASEHSGSALPSVMHDDVLIGQFDIDDQTGEDLAVAIDAVREQAGVLDVLQIAALGKKNRLVSQIQLLIEPGARNRIEAFCFEQTTTLGIRWQRAQRSILKRDETTVQLDGHSINVKQVTRPSGAVTRKADIDDVRDTATSHQSRQASRRIAEDALNEKKKT